MPSSDPDTEAIIDAFAALQANYLNVTTALAARLDLSSTDVRVLLYLGRVPVVTPTHIAEITAMTTGAVTALIDRLTARGLANRQPHPHDRRSVTVALTPQGTEAAQSVEDTYREIIETAFRAPERAAAAYVLRILGAAFEDVEV